MTVTPSDAYNHADKAHQKIDSHEELCAERYNNISITLTDMKATISGHGKLMWGILTAVSTSSVGLLVAIAFKALKLV